MQGSPSLNLLLVTFLPELSSVGVEMSGNWGGLLLTLRILPIHKQMGCHKANGVAKEGQGYMAIGATP